MQIIKKNKRKDINHKIQSRIKEYRLSKLKKFCGFSHFSSTLSPWDKVLLPSTAPQRTKLLKSFWYLYTGGLQVSSCTYSASCIVSNGMLTMVLPDLISPVSNQISHFLRRLLHGQINSCRLGNSPKLYSTDFIKYFCPLPAHSHSEPLSLLFSLCKTVQTCCVILSYCLSFHQVSFKLFPLLNVEHTLSESAFVYSLPIQNNYQIG